MISTTVSGVTSLYAYNGDGARLRQIIAGVPTTYTQDLVAPLPVVVQAKTGTATTQYLYAISTRPLVQYTSGNAEYLLSDALGSVRQIVDANGNVTLAESYEPYGSVLSSNGTASSIFAYAGEQADTTGLIYLRARYMNPRLGVFMTEDTVPGNASLPRSLHIYVYAWNNPINLSDPSGRQVPTPKCKPDEICATQPIGPLVLQTPPVNAEYIPKPPPPELLRLPTGYVSGFSATADLAPWGIHTTDIKIGNQCFKGNGIVAGREWVWDYRHMQKAFFKYSGITQDFGSVIGGWPAQLYTGLVTGFKKSIDDYAGYFRTSEVVVSKSIIGIGGMWAVGLDPITGEEDPNSTQASYGIISLGLGLGLPVGIGTSYTNYERISPIIGAPNLADRPGTALSASRHDREILAEIFARDIESTNPLDQNAGIAAKLARIWGQFDDQ